MNLTILLFLVKLSYCCVTFEIKSCLKGISVSKNDDEKSVSKVKFNDSVVNVIDNARKNRNNGFIFFSFDL